MVRLSVQIYDNHPDHPHMIHVSEPESEDDPTECDKSENPPPNFGELGVSGQLPGYQRARQLDTQQN